MSTQEVDRLEKLLPVIEEAGYAHYLATGPGKKHGCLIAYKTKLYTMNASKLVTYDEEELRSEGDERMRRGRSFQTRNIGSLVSLTSNDPEGRGVILATTHLFWHPRCVSIQLTTLNTVLCTRMSRYTYERVRSVLCHSLGVRANNDNQTEWDSRSSNYSIQIRTWMQRLAMHSHRRWAGLLVYVQRLTSLVWQTSTLLQMTQRIHF